MRIVGTIARRPKEDNSFECLILRRYFDSDLQSHIDVCTKYV